MFHNYLDYVNRLAELEREYAALRDALEDAHRATAEEAETVDDLIARERAYTRALEDLEDFIYSNGEEVRTLRKLVTKGAGRPYWSPAPLPEPGEYLYFS